jgi:glutaredoxin
MQMRFLALLLLLPAFAQAQMYRWTDASGKVHYSDRAPVSGAKNLQKQSMAAPQGATPALPYALQQAVGNFPVALYTSAACKDTCDRARAFLSQRGVPYREYSVVDAADIAQLEKLSGDSRVPVLTVGREVYQGFEIRMYQIALDTAGYPANSLLPPGVEARQAVPKPARKPAATAAPAAPPQESANVAPK